MLHPAHEIWRSERKPFVIEPRPETLFDDDMESPAEHEAREQIEEQVAHLVRDALASEWVRPFDDVFAYVADELGVQDPEVRSALRVIVEESVHDDAVRQVGDQVVEVTRFAEMVQLTHRLGATEVDEDVLELDADLSLLVPLAEVDGGLHRPDDAAPLHLRSRVEFPPESGGSPRLCHRLVGPAGWLDGFSAGDLVVVHGDDGYLTVEAATTAVEAAEPAGVADRLRADVDAAMQTETEGDGTPIGADDLVLRGLIEGWWPADEVLPPIREVVEAMGLEVRGELVGPPGCWETHARLSRAVGMLMRHTHHLDDKATSAVVRFVKAFDDFCADPGTTPDAELAVQLHRSHGQGAMCLHEELQRLDPTGERLLAFVAAMSVPKGPAVAVRHMVESLGHELAGDPVAAEEVAEAAAAADPRWYPAVDARLNHLEARGDLRDTVNVLAVLREPDDPELVRLRERLRLMNPDVGRNEPCPCGSGRKFKQCHQGRTELPLEHRVGWLLERATNWVDRFAELDLDVVRRVVSEAVPSEAEEALSVVVADMVLFELGGLARFLAARRHLLPPDDAALLEAWVAGERTSLYRVEGIADDGTLTLVDLAPESDSEATAATFEVARSQAFSTVSVHGLVWCRLLPVGDRWVSSGVVMRIRLQQRAATLAALEARRSIPVHGDHAARRSAVAGYLYDLLGGDGPGGLVAGDGTPWVHGTATWHVGDDRAAIGAVLEREFGSGDGVPADGDASADGTAAGVAFDEAGDAEWTSLDPDGTVLATIRLTGCLGARVCPGATADPDDEIRADDELDDDEPGDDDPLYGDDDEIDAEFAAYAAKMAAGVYGYDVSVIANSIPRLRAAEEALERLFPGGVRRRGSVTPGARHHAFLRTDQVMESIYHYGFDDEPDELDAWGAADDLDHLGDLDDFIAFDPEANADVTADDGGGGASGRFGEVMGQIPAELRDQVLEEVTRSYEERWLDSAIPALGGRTPREAAADPDLRPDLLTLLAEFGPSEGLQGQMSPARIRAALGLDPA